MPSAEALAASRANPEVLGVEEVHMRRSIGIARVSAAFASLLLLSNAAGAQLAVSANDGHTALVNNTTVGSDNPVPDTITVLDLSVSPPKVVGEVQAPTSVVGPPQSVAITRDESIALVTASSKLDPADPKRLVPDNKVTVIDLKARRLPCSPRLRLALARTACRSTGPVRWRWWPIDRRARCRCSPSPGRR